jgi:hypothetical protein
LNCRSEIRRWQPVLRGRQINKVLVLKFEERRAAIVMETCGHFGDEAEEKTNVVEGGSLNYNLEKKICADYRKNSKSKFLQQQGFQTKIKVRFFLISD